MNSLGILGGSFDPFHLGHLSIAEAALEELSLDKVLLMPAKVSPFKVGRKMASEEDRINMTRCAVENHPGLDVTTIETDASRVSYTFETMKALEELFPDFRIWFIMGSDSMLQLETWYKGEELLRKYTFVLAPRPGYDMTEVEQKIHYYSETYGTEIRVLHNELRDISSTEIKERIRRGDSISHLVPKEVRQYIYEHGIYQ
jgi:nicotinate-nucleotide adenylyltransferase